MRNTGYAGIFEFMEFPDYKFMEYPKWVTVPGQLPVIVENARQEQALFADAPPAPPSESQIERDALLGEIARQNDVIAAERMEKQNLRREFDELKAMFMKDRENTAEASKLVPVAHPANPLPIKK